jgi:hypothetical protein
MHQFMRPRALVALLALSVLAFAPGRAAADFIFTLDTGNTAISGFTGPYAKVDVHLTSGTTATITFTSLTNSGNIYLMGDGGSVALNVNASTFTIGFITGSNAGTGFTPGPYTDAGARNEDGFGVFNASVTSFDGFTHSSDTISLVVTNTSGGTWAAASNVLTANANGALAAAHIFVTSSPANASNGALATGFAAGSGGPTPPANTVPAPPSVVLLGLGGLGLVGFAARPRRRKAVAA